MTARLRMPAARTRGACADRGGFTLLELLVAVVMVSALTVALFDDLRIGFKARASGEAAVEPARTSEGAMDMIRNDLESTLPPNGTLKGNFTGNTGSGNNGHESDVLDFYTTADSPEHISGNGEIKLVELAVETPMAAAIRCWFAASAET